MNIHQSIKILAAYIFLTATPLIASAHNASDAIVKIVGEGDKNTHGSGVLVQIGDNIGVVTCKHVTYEATTVHVYLQSAEGTIKLICNGLKTPEGVHYPRHEDFAVLGADAAELNRCMERLGITPMIVSEQPISKFNDPQDVMFGGFGVTMERRVFATQLGNSSCLRSSGYQLPKGSLLHIEAAISVCQPTGSDPLELLRKRIGLASYQAKRDFNYPERFPGYELLYDVNQRVATRKLIVPGDSGGGYFEATKTDSPELYAIAQSMNFVDTNRPNAQMTMDESIPLAQHYPTIGTALAEFAARRL